MNTTDTIKMDAGLLIQDLYHHSLAMMGRENGMDANNLLARLDCSARAAELIGRLDDGPVRERFEPVMPNNGFRSEQDLIAAGSRLNEAVKEWALLCMVDPNTGEQVEAKPAAPRKSYHHGGWKGQGCAVLPVGTVNLKTAGNAMFGTIWNCWEQDAKSTNILVREDATFKVVHTSGSGADYVAGDTMSLKHDQTGRRMGNMWTVVGTAPHTAEGLLELKRMSGKSTLAFATFK